MRAGVTRPTAHRLIQTLIGEGYLAQNPDDSRITPGYSVLMLAGSLLDTNQIRLESLPHLEALARTTGERVQPRHPASPSDALPRGVEKPSLPTIFSRFGKTAPAYSLGDRQIDPRASAGGRSSPLSEGGAACSAYGAHDHRRSGVREAELAEVRRVGYCLRPQAKAFPATYCIGAADHRAWRAGGGHRGDGRALEPIMPLQGRRACTRPK